MSARSARRAFTLIELIVGCLILAVLTTIAATAYNQFVGGARTTAVLGTALQLDKAVVAKSAADELTPAAEVLASQPGAAPTPGPGLATYLGINLFGAGAAYNAGTGELQLSVAAERACIKLGTAVGQANQGISSGPCATSTGWTPLS